MHRRNLRYSDLGSRRAWGGRPGTLCGARVTTQPFVERESDLAALAGWAAEAAAGDGRAALISGEAGIGKTTLVEHVRGLVPDAEWLEGASDPLSVPRPLGPFLDMAAELGPDIAAELRGAVEPGGLFTRVLDRVTDPVGLCVVVVEDLHWGDEATLDLVRFLARRIRNARVLLLATFRDDGAGEATAFARVVGELVQLPAARRMELQPLTVPGVARLCDGTGRSADEVHRLTDGNPFFVTELLRADTAEMPRSVRDAITGRLAALPPVACEAIRVASLVGRRVDLALIDRLVPDGPEHLGLLVDRGLLVERETGPWFRHELTRLAVAETVPTSRRADLHRQILDALVASECRDDGRLARHAEGCGDAASTLLHSRRAGHHAARFGSIRDAADHYRRALAACDEDDARGRAELYDDLADAVGYLGQVDAATDLRERAIAAWTARGETRDLARSLFRSVWSLNAGSRVDEAFASARRAIDLLEPLGPSPELAAAYAAFARILMLHDRHDEVVAITERAGAMAVELALDDVRADLANTEACSRAVLGEPWRDRLLEALAIAERLADGPRVVRACFNFYCMLVVELRSDEADEWYQRTAERAEEYDLGTYQLGIRRMHSLTLLRRGRWRAAASLSPITAATPEESPHYLIEPRVIASVVAARRGEPVDPELLEAALRHAEACAQPQSVVPVRVARAEVAWLAGDLEAAWKELALARDLGLQGRDLVRDVEVWAHRTGLGATTTPLPGPAAAEVAGAVRAAARAWDAASCPYDAALALLSSEREAELRESVTRFDELGAVVPARLARRRMRELGHRSVPVDAHPATRAHPKHLTVREQEVLALVAEGRRNKDIAEALVLSPRTVGSHVSSIIRKLGVLNRGEAAAWAREHDGADVGSVAEET